MNRYRVAGYVKLAKLWERKREASTSLHIEYYKEKYKDDTNMDLQSVYIDITGNKEIWKRVEMLHLLSDCVEGKIDCIATQTKAYLAANTEDFFFLINYLFTLPNRVDLITEDKEYNINTIVNMDNQREALLSAAQKYIYVEPQRYVEWVEKVDMKIRPPKE